MNEALHRAPASRRTPRGVDAADGTDHHDAFGVRLRRIERGGDDWEPLLAELREVGVRVWLSLAGEIDLAEVEESLVTWAHVAQVRAAA